MPKDVAKLITTLDELYRKIEYTLEEHQLDGEDILDNINSATDSLSELNDELDNELEQE